MQALRGHPRPAGVRGGRRQDRVGMLVLVPGLRGLVRVLVLVSSRRPTHRGWVVVAAVYPRSPAVTSKVSAPSRTSTVTFCPGEIADSSSIRDRWLSTS